VFDYDGLANDVALAVEALDNVIDSSQYPTEIIAQEMRSKRRMGLGVTGVANAIEAMGYPYGSPGFVHELEGILAINQHSAWLASINLAKTRGAFPLFDADKYLSSPYISKMMPEHIKDKVRKYGIRNSHTTSIAPTGTISMCADNVSSGIEPVFEYHTQRKIGTPSGPKEVSFPDYGVVNFGHKGKTSNDVTIAEHLAVLSIAQKYVDSAVSKTVNCPDNMTFEEFKTVYMDAWQMDIKGVATFRKNGKRMALLTAAVPSEVAQEGASCTIDPQTGAKTCG
jgi:ribonucleoside-diphosphate reductase alpha chain